MITYSQEMLSHFQCSDCKSWWTVGDHKDTKLEWPMPCPHCGTQHFEYESAKAAPEVDVDQTWDEGLLKSLQCSLDYVTAERDALRIQLEHAKDNHRCLVDKNAILRQRPDLPVDRIPAHNRLEEQQAEIEKLQSQLFEARQALLKEGMRANALQARIDDGIRVSAYRSGIYGGYACLTNTLSGKTNATLILDEGVSL